MKHRQRKKKTLGKKRKHKDEYNLVDRLIESPDDVLVSILSLLSLKEAATTSILSRRWRYVWPSTMALDFDAKFFDDEVYKKFRQLQPALREQESLRYVNWVNHVVEQHRGPSIERFRGTATNLLLNNVPFLVEVSVSERPVRIFSDEVHVYRKSIELPFTQLSCCLSQLEIFMLDIDLAVYNQDYVFPVLANVKHLELTVKANYDMDLFHLTSFMKASPLVQRLLVDYMLNFTTLAGMGPIKSAGEYPHHYLKVLEIVGYRAHTCVVQHVLHLIKSAVALEKIIVHPVQRLNESYVRVREAEKVEEAKARDHAMQCLREKVPSTIEFVCL
ncbi:F-box/FBD/LRR-repeat protein [Prunus yedoensis var. nudiflora]|uniref:F-box/FBD/LRR-repeat protein n=1 Tax=Prunus yedoensis var. nudiflora TaxID=2094558 RepID=A0A314YQS7_PRUYE|nr:F-box/FBD/LRR-repeat protein [Prunus yedoensis var. nudiflora]